MSAWASELHGKRVLLIISGGIAAYKCLEVIRRLRDRDAEVRCILTRAGEQFVTPLSLAALSEDKVYGDLFSLTDESEMGHIRLSREADVVLVAPATAHILGRMAGGLADDLATTALLATDKPVVVAPAMNVRMWEHPATRANIEVLKTRGVRFIGPNDGDMACGEYGPGRMAEPDEIVTSLEGYLGRAQRLSGCRALVTSGPTHEPIDRVRYIANRSSGKQGHAIAAAFAELGAETCLVSGPVQLPNPPGVETLRVETARQMLEACEASLPVDVAVFAAAVSDWHVAQPAAQKLKKEGDESPPPLLLSQNPDILAAVCRAGALRPKLVVGFAAETTHVIDNAREKRQRKGCDWILANDVSSHVGTFGGDANTVHLITDHDVEAWPAMSKLEVARRLAERVADTLVSDQ